MSTWSYKGVQTSFAGVRNFLHKEGLFLECIDSNQRTAKMGKIVKQFLTEEGLKCMPKGTISHIDINCKKVQKHWTKFVRFVKQIQNQ